MTVWPSTGQCRYLPVSKISMGFFNIRSLVQGAEDKEILDTVLDPSTSVLIITVPLTYEVLAVH